MNIVPQWWSQLNGTLVIEYHVPEVCGLYCAPSETGTRRQDCQTIGIGKHDLVGSVLWQAVESG